MHAIIACQLLTKSTINIMIAIIFWESLHLIPKITLFIYNIGQNREMKP